MVVYLLKKTQSQSGCNVTTSVEVIKLSLSSCLILCVCVKTNSVLTGRAASGRNIQDFKTNGFIFAQFNTFNQDSGFKTEHLLTHQWEETRSHKIERRKYRNF